MRTRRYLVPSIVALALVATACGSDGDDGAADTTVAAAAETTAAAADDTTAPAEADIVDTAVAAGSFTTLVAAVEAAGLVDTLKSAGPFTVFAPTDDAFAALPEGLLEALLLPENKEVLAQILTYHVLAGEVLAADVAAGSVATVEGSDIEITTDGGVKVNDANVVQTDIMTSNGVIHVIDAVILPPGVDPAALLATEEEAMAEEEMAEADIVDTAVAAGSFSTLVSAVEAAGLVDTLKGAGPFTVFAPTDDAFAALPAGVLDKLLLPENQAVLAQILTYHVLAGEVLAADVAAGSVATVEGSNIEITTEGGVMVNGANVVQTDIITSNGVIHVIDAVILPPGVDPAAL